jgi:hypothetical protein
MKGPASPEETHTSTSSTRKSNSWFRLKIQKRAKRGYNNGEVWDCGVCGASCSDDARRKKGAKWVQCSNCLVTSRYTANCRFSCVTTAAVRRQKARSGVALVASPVSTEICGGQCGFTFKVAKTWLVFSVGKNVLLLSLMCLFIVK